MANSLNKVMLIGNLGKDPEMRYTASGQAVTTFSVAVNRTRRTPEGVVAWQKLAEICNEYLHKGSKVYIEGRLQTRKWQDPQGQDRFTTEVIANDMQMLDSRPGTGGAPAGRGAEEPEMSDDDIPF